MEERRRATAEAARSEREVESLRSRLESLETESSSRAADLERRLEVALGAKLEHMLALREEVEQVTSLEKQRVFCVHTQYTPNAEACVSQKYFESKCNVCVTKRHDQKVDAFIFDIFSRLSNLLDKGRSKQYQIRQDENITRLFLHIYERVFSCIH